MRRVGSLSMRTRGIRSSHSQSFTHFRRIARNSASTLLTVALLQPSASFTSVIRSIIARLIAVSSLPRKIGVKPPQLRYIVLGRRLVRLFLEPTYRRLVPSPSRLLFELVDPPQLGPSAGRETLALGLCWQSQ